METLASPPGLLTIEEYMEFEQSSTIKHEYVGGMLHALAGGSDRHNRIAIGIVRALADAADGGPWRVYMSDMRLQIGDVFYYPDVMVACEEPESDNPVFRSNPCLLVEVLSPSTESADRREKLLMYREIPTLRAYLVVDQRHRRVERHYRGEDGAWHRGDFVHRGTVPVPCPETDLTLERIYRGL
jgi:Uma2 family endonuclease